MDLKPGESVTVCITDEMLKRAETETVTLFGNGGPQFEITSTERFQIERTIYRTIWFLLGGGVALVSVLTTYVLATVLAQ